MRSDRGRSRRGRVRSEEGGSQKIDGTYVRGWQRGRSETMCQMEAKARLPKNDRCELLLVRQGTTTRPEKYERHSVGSGAANVLQGKCE